ncbi:hypothetical protein BTM25_19400 [Actinomadura rubteroloni]|uniref:DUF2269 family protein n=1 Tax=Actinomadura rubteroloni TaxID=1926885 RepID=A0A2P4UR77_9ACTN|nr:hypothetical protein [Actinomadura rubteroloni]POM27524.1 hypothetical protein BTM25_19400 [Actinomadura rubteroloni]
MSTSDRLLLVLHVGFAIFTLGPLTAATMSTPRYIRQGNVTVVRYLHRTTQIYGLGTLGIFLFGLFLADGAFSEAWLSVSMTLFVVALALLLVVARDQGHAVKLLTERTAKDAAEDEPAGDVAPAERGRIAALSGIVALLWLVILVLMVWNG